MERPVKIEIDKDEEKRIYINDDIFIDISNNGGREYDIYVFDQMKCVATQSMDMIGIREDQYTYDKRTVKELNREHIHRAEVTNILSILDKHTKSLQDKFAKLCATKRPLTASEIMFTEKEVQELFKGEVTYIELCPNTDDSISVFVVFEGKVGVFYEMNKIHLPYKGFQHKRTIEYYTVYNSFSDETTLELNERTLRAIDRDECRL